MRKRLTMRLGAAGIGALVVLALAAPPAYGLVRSADPVPPAGLTGLEPTGADMPTVGGNLGNQHYSGSDADRQEQPRAAGARVAHASCRPSRPRATNVGQQTTPIVVDGVIYVDTPERRRDRRRRRDGRRPSGSGTSRVYGLSGTRRGVSAGDGKIFTLGRRQPRRRARPGHRRGGLGGAAHRAGRRGPRTRRKGRDGVLRRNRLRPRGRRRPRRGRRAGRERRLTTSGTSSAGRSAASSSQGSTA